MLGTRQLSAHPVPLLAAGRGVVETTSDALSRIASLRGRRVFILLLGVWILNAFDLTLTLRAWSDGVLYEENPIARRLLERGPTMLFAGKLILVTTATAVLFHLRRFRCAEMASALSLVIYAGVAVQWKYCYELYHLAHSGSVVSGDFTRFDAIIRTVPVL